MSKTNAINSEVAAVLGIDDATVSNNTSVALSSVVPAGILSHTPIAVHTDQPDQIGNDAEYARDNLYDVINKSTLAIHNLMTVAQQSQSPRAFEVLNQLLNTQRETAAQLIKLHTDKQKAQGITNKPAIAGNTTISQAIFVGTNSQLLDLIKGKNKAEEQEVADAEFYTTDDTSNTTNT